MKRYVKDRQHLYQILAREEKIVKQPLYSEIKTSTDYRRYHLEKSAKRWADTKEWMRSIGCAI